MNSFFNSLKSKEFYILHFTFYIIITPLLLLMLSCSSTTEIKKGELSGVVNLEGQSDFSGITVSLYDLAYLDTTIVRINNQYPQIGVKITQHTEFDHRLQSTVKTTTTEADGSFELNKIPTGEYNVVAMKAGFGFKYLYEITIVEGDNDISEFTPSANLSLCHPERSRRAKDEQNGVYSSHKSSVTLNVNRLSEDILSGHSTKSLGIALYPERSEDTISHRTSDLTLYPETHLSGNISDDITVATDHHLVIDDDTVFLPNTSSLTIEPGAVIRINPGVDLIIHGILIAQGEEDNMFWITSNSGFAAEVRSDKGKERSYSVSHFPFPISRESIELYNSMELSPYAIVTDDLIEWGKWDWGNSSLVNNLSDISFEHSSFCNNSIGLYSATQDSTFSKNLNFQDNNEKGLYYLNNINGKISENIFTNNDYGSEIKHRFCGTIKNNYYYSNDIGIFTWSFHGDIINNEFLNNIYSVKLIGNNDNIEKNIELLNNNFINKHAVWQTSTSSYAESSDIYLNYNNFINNSTFVAYYSGNLENPIQAENNYWDGYMYNQEIYNKIYDTWYDPDVTYEFIIIDPFSNAYFNDAGIQGE